MIKNIVENVVLTQMNQVGNIVQIVAQRILIN